METTHFLTTTIALMTMAIFFLALNVWDHYRPKLEERKKQKYARKLIRELKLGHIESLTELFSSHGKRLFELINTNPKDFSIDKYHLKLPNEYGDITIWISNGKEYYQFEGKNLKEGKDTELNYYDRELVEAIVKMVKIQQNSFKIGFEEVKINNQ